MNTADRSIQLLDTALRRRFTFIEAMPDPKHRLISNDIDGVDCQEMLAAMNERIAALLDREHQIGHTYLLEVAEIGQLSDTFRNRMLPLLQEYFFDDWGEDTSGPRQQRLRHGEEGRYPVRGPRVDGRRSVRLQAVARPRPTVGGPRRVPQDLRWRERPGTGRRLMRDVLTVREHEKLALGPKLTREDVADLEAVARRALKHRDGDLAASKHVGIVTTRRGLVVEILPKLDLGGESDPDHERTRQVFLRMLRCSRRLPMELPESGIRAMRRFPMLEVFVRQFLRNLETLARTGLARRYVPVEESLPFLRGRILFREQLRQKRG